MSKHSKPNLTFIGKGLWPNPVYEAQFADGEVIRMSFWTQLGKPIDFDRGRRVCALTSKVSYIDALGPEGLRIPLGGELIIAERTSPVVMGYVHQDGERTPDPYFSAQDKPAKVNGTRVTAKLAKEALRELLAYLDGRHDNSAAVERARELAA